MKRLFILFVFLFASSELFAQSWSVWRTIPVFDGERVMPLSSFADQIVKEICGTSRPFLRLDDDVLDGLTRLQEEYAAAHRAALDAAARKNFDNTDSERDSIFNYSRDDLLNSLDSGFGSEAMQEKAIGQEHRRAVLENVDPEQIELIRHRIQLLVPPQGRYFDSTELLLSWLGEPETWNYIPIFDSSESDYRSDVLGAATINKLRYRLHRISVVQLLQSKAYQQRLREIELKRYELGNRYTPTRYDLITERIQRALDVYQELTFHPLRYRPTRMLGILHGTLEGSTGRDASLNNCRAAWDYLLGVGDDADSHGGGSNENDHPTTERWRTIFHRIMTLTAAFDQTDAKGKAMQPNLDAFQRQFETLLELIDQHLDESASLMEAAYPGVKFRKKIPNSPEVSVLPRLFTEERRKEDGESLKKLVLRYHYSVKTLRCEIETAYLALYDNGRSLRVLPIISEQTLGGDDAVTDQQPWASLQAVLFGEDVLVRRFFDPRFDSLKRTEQMSIRTETETESFAESENETNIAPSFPGTATTPHGSELKDELTRELFGPSTNRFMAMETRDPATTDSIRWIRVHFEKLVSVYETIGNDFYWWSNAGREFTESAVGLRDSLRDAAGRIDTAREELLDDSDSVRRETLLKTSYPVTATYPEYRYFRLAPFYWMWVFAAISIGFVLLALVVERQRRKLAATAQLPGQETLIRQTDFTHSIEEYVYWTGIAFLLLSVFVTFLGGSMRAWITGWIPVTNMYETIILAAFSASLLGLWYALSPLLYPAIVLAWRLSSFPAVANLFSSFAVGKTPTTTEQSGSDAMRQAAADFGMLNANQLGDSYDDPDEKERLIRKRSEFFWRSLLVVPRLILVFLTFLLIVQMCYGEYAHEHGVLAAMTEMLTMHDILDWCVVIASMAIVVWFVPHLLLTLAIAAVLLARPGRLAAEAGVVSRHRPETVTVESRRRSELSGVFSGETNIGVVHGEIDNSWLVWLNGVRNEILDRKLYILAGAAVALLAGLAAYYNSSQFNPSIRPLVAVLRSNFWLTVHVIAIILSYAAASVAWAMSVVALGGAIFGQYRRETTTEGKRLVLIPTLCGTMVPSIYRLLRIAVFLLALGTILGARWADYSWGRFWSWDPKEVWALITLLFFAIVLHGRTGRLYGQFGIAVGGLLGSIAVIMTWYGINYVFKAGMHAYGGGTTENATIFLGVFIVANLLWGGAALGRYGVEVFGTENEAY